MLRLQMQLRVSFPPGKRAFLFLLDIAVTYPAAEEGEGEQFPEGRFW